MSQAQILKLKTVKTPTAPMTRSRHASKALRRQTVSAVGVGAIALTLTALSLTHLAHGIEIVTQAPSWETYALAIGIDLGFMAAEFAQLMAVGDRLRRTVGKFARPAIAGTLIGSAAMNAFAFASAATGWMIAPAIVLGIAIPGMIYALTRIGAALYIDCHAKS